MDEIIYHELVQGSDEWLHFRSQHDGASEAAAMLGLSRKVTRTELLNLKHTGISKEFRDYVQRKILDYGHEVEAMARPIIGQELGKKLYPVTISRGSRMSASCDGMTMDESVGWEHKQYNKTLFDAVSRKELPDEYMPQVQQCLMLSGANLWIFTVSDGTEENMASMAVAPDQAWFDRIKSGWEQFHKDLKDYTPAEVKETPKAESIKALPSVFVQATGMVTASNLSEFKEAADVFIANINTELICDQDFADAESTVKFCKEAEQNLEATKSSVLAQMSTVDEVVRTLDHIAAQLRDKRLILDKLVKSEKDARRLNIVMSGGMRYAEHLTALQIPVEYMPLMPRVDFGAAVKGLKSLSSMQDKVDSLLANTKIEADAIARDINAKLAWCKDTSAGYGFLFNDLAQIISKPMDDFQLVITSRIEKHKADEAARIEAETVRIQAEATAKAEREAAAKLAQEEARIRAEEQAKARAEAASLAQAKADEAAKIAAEQAVMAKAQAKEDAQVAKHCGDDAVVVNCSKPVGATKEAIINVIAVHFKLSISDAENAIVSAFF